LAGKTKLQVAIKGLKQVKDVVMIETARIYVDKALAEIKAMPDENCGNCKHLEEHEVELGNGNFNYYHFCKSQGCLRGRLEDKEFCSRFEAKEKGES